MAIKSSKHSTIKFSKSVTNVTQSLFLKERVARNHILIGCPSHLEIGLIGLNVWPLSEKFPLRRTNLIG